MHTGNDTWLGPTLWRPPLWQRLLIRMVTMLSPWSWQKGLVTLLIPIAALTSFFAISGTTLPPSIALSADPLYAPTSADKPALVLGLSVEFPTVGAQYLDPAAATNATTDGSYANTTEYLGYYDAESCYTYNKAPTETPVSPLTTDDYKRFDRSGPATNRMCTGETFSGNFLNWASSSAIDMLRLALTGGDRYIDTSTKTILQRAVLPHDGNGFPSGYGKFWNSKNFPAKQLLRSGGTSGTPYFGAVPQSMRTTAAASSKDIWVANDLNKIYFGTSNTGTTSASSTSYTLGAPPASWIGTATTRNSMTGWTGTAYSNGSTITLPTGVWEVIYGYGGTWTSAPAVGTVTCGAPSFTNPSSNSNNKCYVRADITGQIPPALSGSDYFFYARVQVCDRDSSTYALKDVRDYGLCTTYSDGQSTPHPNYKPTGVIQKYSDQLRLAAFGYLMDQTTSRVGGVLRAPIKYVGPNTFDINGQNATANTKMEWNLTTGVFIANPEGNSTIASTSPSGSYLSGVINYINQFGRTGSIPGRYKIYDPLSELHYEALRYLQGLQPSSTAISGLPGTTDLYDGFPAYTTWSDPYGDGRSSTGDYSCLKSNIVMIGDKNTQEQSGSGTGSTRLPSANVANNYPNFDTWRTVVQNFEKNVTTATYTDGAGTSRRVANPNGANSAVPTGVTSMVMGTAYWAHTHDIRSTSWTNASTSYSAGTALQRPGLRVKTYMFDVNEGGGSTSLATRSTSNQLFMAAKYGGFEADPSNTAKNPYNTYGNPFINEQDGTNNNKVWLDTGTRVSRAGDAGTYFLQSDARGVLSAFDDIFSRASTAARSIAGGAIQSKNLTQAGDTIYQGTFEVSDWSGDLLAIPVSVSSSNVVTVSNSTTWSAASLLKSRAPSTRNIVVGNAWAPASPNPVASNFTWSTITGTSLATSLNKASASATEDGLGEARLNYLRGDQTNQGTLFRARTELMGDVINSGVVYSGAPTTTISDSGYSSFYSTNKNRTPAIFVGANDGMLHAFNANTGSELFAYIPSWLGPKLSALTNTTYNNSHQSYLDGTPAVAEALVGSDWKTVLISGTGGGGKGVFALDVTNPTALTASKVLWEFTSQDDPDLGYVTGRPQILKIRTDSSNYKWFAVFGSGVNNYVADSYGVASSTGQPALFLLDLSKPAGTSWIKGTNYYKISLPVNSTTLAAGLLNFRAALGTAKEVTYIFMGDLQGNFWKLDFSTAASTADWDLGHLSYFNQGSTSSPIPMFIAKDTSGNVQPISAAPSIVFGPVSGSFYALFGTGKYLEGGDKSSTANQSEYMLYDNGTSSVDSSPKSTATSAISSRLRLKLGTSNASTGVITVPAFTLGRATSDLDTSNPRSGWVFDLPNPGERQISNGTISGSKIIFGTLIPGSSSAASCSAAGGGGNQYTIEIQTGSGTSIGSSVGILGEPMVAEISSATTYTTSDSTGRRIKTITSQIFQQGSNGITAGGSGSSSNTITKQITTGRITWRQINSYQDLKNATP
jgi:type IV pilus assembly protein PilY1